MSVVRFPRLALALAFTVCTAPAFAEVDWLAANGQSCELVCKKARMRPVVAGTFKDNTNVFFVCSANQAGEGFRSGYNLKPHWANVCMVGYGGKEVRATNYTCACQ